MTYNWKPLKDLLLAVGVITCGEKDQGIYRIKGMDHVSTALEKAPLSTAVTGEVVLLAIDAGWRLVKAGNKYFLRNDTDESGDYSGRTVGKAAAKWFWGAYGSACCCPVCGKPTNFCPNCGKKR